MASILVSFDKWKDFLENRVKHAENSGMNDESISNLAFEIGEFLSDKVDPKNNQERLLKELWDVGDEQERKTMARLMMKLVKNG